MKDKIAVKVDQELLDLIPEFLLERVNDLKKINEALVENDLDIIKSIGHIMKGTGGGYGFDKITEIGSVIENAANACNTEEISRQALILEDYLERVEIVYIEEE